MRVSRFNSKYLMSVQVRMEYLNQLRALRVLRGKKNQYGNATHFPDIILKTPILRVLYYSQELP